MLDKLVPFSSGRVLLKMHGMSTQKVVRPSARSQRWRRHPDRPEV